MLPGMYVGVVLTAGDVTSRSSVLSDVCFREWKWAWLKVNNDVRRLALGSESGRGFISR